RRGERDRPITLMEIATALMRWRRDDGALPEVVFSEEINACTVRVGGEERAGDDASQPDGVEDRDASRGGVRNGGEAWLLLFKNETHNHPTEIEPYGGAATCLGGAIRDPLSGRSYVFQAMRISGSADPRRRPIASAGLLDARGGATGPAIGSPTLPGKLSQRSITRGAARGYSSYGNQIGVATGLVDEIYHPGYQAKRLEMGAVVGAVPEAHVRREEPADGDVVLLVGGRTGRDGVGGATGSSRSHTRRSIDLAGAEVQKGNPPVERALQRLFRKREFSLLVKRCNDFGAGGVAVAVGEIARGVEIDLDAVPLKYDGLTATEIAISESQERMAIVVDRRDCERAIALAREENVEAAAIARVTSDDRLVMRYRGRVVVELERAFLDSAGVRATTRARIRIAGESIAPPRGGEGPSSGLKRLEGTLGDLRFASRLALGEWFDSSIGAGTLLAPGAGRLQRSPTTAMAALLPHTSGPGADSIAAVTSYGYDPDIASASPWHGAYTAVVESVARLAAAGVSRSSQWLSLQEYFPRPGTESDRWGAPLAALLGAAAAQRDLGVTAIGGKDSMSGTYEHLDVPPTLISVAVGVCPPDRVVAAHLVSPDASVYLLHTPVGEDGVPSAATFDRHRRWLEDANRRGELLAAAPVRGAGFLAALAQMCFGENLGFDPADELDYRTLPDAGAPLYGSFIVQIVEGAPGMYSDAGDGRHLLGVATTDGMFRWGGEVRATDALYRVWAAPLDEVFPSEEGALQGRHSDACRAVAIRDDDHGAGDIERALTMLRRPRRKRRRSAASFGRPTVLIPVFPGSNCEDDSAAAFERAGAVCEQFVVRTSTRDALDESLGALAERFAAAQIVMLPGGFSAGDEPAGSGKYIAALLRSPVVREVIERDYLARDERLMLGICNGFQAMVRTGLLPFGAFVEREAGWPALAPNLTAHHVSRSVLTQITSTHGPWLADSTVGDIVSVPVSHGEGRFMCDPDIVGLLESGGQIAARYVDWQARAREDRPWNPNGSVGGVEALLSPDGRFLGKMGHTERQREGLYRNLPSVGSQRLFESGVAFFR
ncbi:MAG: phosphoribosylformylglycinamidine synthase, partial [Spirochaetales bacterium]|nr:phosphoribosylformylglycinamidine synthase [Spirochaetales bacterium]